MKISRIYHIRYEGSDICFDKPETLHAYMTSLAQRLSADLDFNENICQYSLSYSGITRLIGVSMATYCSSE